METFNFGKVLVKLFLFSLIMIVTTSGIIGMNNQVKNIMDSNLKIASR